MSEIVWVEKIKNQLKLNLSVGKPLRYRWFREKKFRNKRLFYFINAETKRALLMAFVCKKDQKRIINYLLFNKERYLKFLSDSFDASFFQIP